jgi:hypothetical protein
MMYSCCGICKFYEHPTGYCDAALPDSIEGEKVAFMKPTAGGGCGCFELACTDCYEDCKHVGRFDHPKSCKLMKRKKT